MFVSNSTITKTAEAWSAPGPPSPSHVIALPAVGQGQDQVGGEEDECGDQRLSSVTC